MPSIRFLGAAGTVTGSRFLVSAHGRRILFDAGLFQGQKELRLRNWNPFPVEPSSIDAIVLTHAHIDHIGAVPLLTRSGFRGPVTCTAATRDLAHLLLPDSGRLQEEEARYANKRGFSKHAPNARPLYTEVDAVSSLRQLTPLPYHTRRELFPGLTIQFSRAGHILIPAFAVGRTQDILFTIRELESTGAIPELPVFVDSPMAVDATPIYLAHREDHDDEMARLLASGVEPLRPARLTFSRSPEQSKAINRVKGPCIIISASGMATGGRILHHLANRLSDEQTTVLLVGFQAAGTRGARLQSGAESLRIYGQDVPVRAHVATLSGFSAHADRGETDRWLATLPSPPKRVFCVHGEPPALAATSDRLKAKGWNVTVPRHLEEIELGA